MSVDLTCIPKSNSREISQGFNPNNTIFVGLETPRTTEIPEKHRIFNNTSIDLTYYEQNRIINPDSPQGQTFQRECEALIRRMYPNYDFVKNPVAFVLFESNQPNAFFNGISASTPLIGISTSFFKPSFQKNGEKLEALISSVDTLAAVLAHEWKHYQIRGVGCKESPTKMEEAQCQYESVVALLDGGLDPLAELRLSKELAKRYPTKRENTWSAAFDEHLLPVDSVRFVEAALTKLSEERGGFGKVVETKFTVDKELYQAVTTARHITWLGELLERMQFKSASLSEKVELLQNVIDKAGWTKFPWRGLDVARTIQALPLEGAENKELVDRLATVIFDSATVIAPSHSSALAGMYSSLYRVSSGADQGAVPKPLNRLIRLDKALEKFIEAKGSKSIVGAAKRVMLLLKNEPLAQSPTGRALLESIHWKEFPLPKVPAKDRYTIRTASDFKDTCDDAYTEYVSYERHLDCARKNGEPVSSVLAMLGISEPRLIRRGTLSPVMAKGIQNKELLTFGKHPWSHHIENCLEELCSKKLVASSPCIDDFIKQLRNDRLIALAFVSGETTAFEISSYWGQFEDDDSEIDDDEPQWYDTNDEIDVKKRGKVPLVPLEKWNLLTIDPVTFIRECQDQLITSGPDYQKFSQELSKLYFSDPVRHRELLRTIFKPLGETSLESPRMPEQGLFFSFLECENSDAFVLDPARNPLVKLLHALPDSCLTPVEKLNILGSLFASAPSSKFSLDLSQQLTFDRTRIMKSVSSLAARAFPDIFKANMITSWTEAIRATKVISAKAPLSLPFLQCLLVDFAATTAPKLRQVLELAQYIKLDFHPSFLLDLYTAFPKEKFEKVFANMPLKEALSRWRELHATSFLPLDVTYSYLNPLLDQLEKEVGSVKLAEAERLLTIEPALYSMRDESNLNNSQSTSQSNERIPPKEIVQIEEPRIRSRCLQLIAQSFVEVHGEDDGSEKYKEKVLEEVEYLKHALNWLDKKNLLVMIDHETCSQRELSYALEAQLPTVETFNQKGHTLCAGVELLLAISKNHPGIQNSMVDLIVSDGGNGPVEKFYAVIPDELKDRFFSRGGSAFSHSHSDLIGQVSGDEDLVYDEGKLTTDIARASEIKTLEQKEQVRLAYLHFWSLPLEARAVFARELLPDVTDQQEGEASIPTCFEAVANRMFSDGKEHAVEARAWLRDYISVIPVYQRGLMLSSCLIAAQRGTSQDLPVGDVLAILLENLGPGPIKAGQGGSCHPDLPQHLQKPLRRLKYSADLRPRWECHHWLDDRLPTQHRNEIVHVGPILGQASLWVTLRVARQIAGSDEKLNRVISLLRPYAQERLEYGCDTLTRLSHRIANPKASRITAQLVKEALRSGLLEIDSHDSKTRHEVAKSQYEREVVIIDGEKFAFTAAAIVEAGDGYKEMDEIPGRHVADVISDENLDELHRRRLAMAILTREVNFILRGLPFCNDRHGGNGKEENQMIGHYDLGSFELATPNEEDIRHLAGLILRLGASFATGGSASKLAEAIDEHTQEIQMEEGKPSPFLMRVQKAFLSLGDCISVLSKEDCLECLAAAAAHEMHPSLMAALISEVMTRPELAAALEGLNTSGRVSIVSLH